MSIMVSQVQTVDPGFSVSFSDQMLYNFPSVLMALSFIWILTKMYKSSEFVLPGGKQYFEEEYRKLGKMSFTKNESPCAAHCPDGMDHQRTLPPHFG